MLAIGGSYSTYNYFHFKKLLIKILKNKAFCARFITLRTLLFSREAKRNMKIDNALVERLAELSKLEFNETEKQRIINDLQNIFDLVEKLNEVNVDGVEPLIYMSDEVNVLRKDEVQGQVPKSEALLNAPQKDSDYFKVPKVIKK
jgi:aspartyl-tRNA(Asn)/glutamyl-tRNA(Gln) amidotransferase subunit C